MKMFFLGVYVAGAIAAFIIVSFFCMLGGKNSDMWKPFVYALIWPFVALVTVLQLFFGR